MLRVISFFVNNILVPEGGSCVINYLVTLTGVNMKCTMGPINT